SCRIPSARLFLIHFLSFSITTVHLFFSALSLHDALPIFADPWADQFSDRELFVKICSLYVCTGTDRFRICLCRTDDSFPASHDPDRKSTRLNSSHVSISYAVFCLKKKRILIKIIACLSAY